MSKSLDTGTFMTNPSGTVENLTKFQPKWKHGKTQTIRVPIALAERTLALARKLDNGSDSLDTVNNKLSELYERNGKLARQCEKLQAESSKLQDSLDTAEDTIADLKNEIANLSSTQAANLAVSSELEQLKAQLAELRSQLSSQTAPQVSESVELPNAADLLNQLKAKRKKSKTDLQDVEAILELLPEQSPPKLPDLYAARDAIMDKWRLVKRNEKRERFWSFANELIEEAAKLDPNYSLLARLQSDLKQEREYSKGIAKGMADEFRKRIDLEKKVGLRR